MAEGAQAQIPTFKLVLVGDGGTGKVSLSPWQSLLVAYLFSLAPQTAPDGDGDCNSKSRGSA